MIADELLAERGIDLLEHRARRREGLGQRLAHADGLAALARKHECRRTFRLRQSDPPEDTGPKDMRAPPSSQAAAERAIRRALPFARNSL